MHHRHRGFSIRPTEDEGKLARSYAILREISTGEAFKRALLEKIEDEYYIAVADAAYKRHPDNPRTYTHDEVLRMFDDGE